ncbi:MAG: hypothetical protein WC763_05050 [Candidatus Paceibacterota bacterium]
MDIHELENIIRETFWMARRYANGRMTFAPSTIRNCYRVIKSRFPHLIPKKDETIDEAKARSFDGLHDSDYLTDCND